MIAPYGILFDSSRVDCVRACVRPKRIAGGVDERDTRMRNYQEMHACALCNRRMRAGRTCPRWYFLSLSITLSLYPSRSLCLSIPVCMRHQALVMSFSDGWFGCARTPRLARRDTVYVCVCSRGRAALSSAPTHPHRHAPPPPPHARKFATHNGVPRAWRRKIGVTVRECNRIYAKRILPVCVPTCAYVCVCV